MSSRTGSLRLVKWLPPINRQNTPHATGALLFGLAAWFASGIRLLDFVTTETALSSRGPFSEAIEVIGYAYSPKALGLAMLLIGVQLLLGYQFLSQSYEGVSAPMLAEIPCRIGIYWFLVTVFMQFVLLITGPLGGELTPTRFTELRVLTLFITAKLTMEWALVQIRQQNNPGRITRWLMPQCPE